MTLFGQDEGGDRRPLYARYSIELEGAADAPNLSDGDAKGLLLKSTRGDIPCLFHAPNPDLKTTHAVLFVPGARGGFGGPGNGLYAEVADALANQGIAGLRVGYRKPSDLDECTLDTLVAVWHLASQGYERMAIVGHSFGGAVAIGAARYTTHIRAVVAMASQTHGAEDVQMLGPRPLLLVHGNRDGVVPAYASQIIYDWAFEPKEMRIFDGAEHGLRECRDEVRELLLDWLPKHITS
jgi:alpha/beta superfamily hydrolase